MNMITIEWSKTQWINRHSYLSNRIPTYRGAARVIAKKLNMDGNYIKPSEISIHRIYVAGYAKK